MMKPGDIWGPCPYRYVGWALDGQRIGGWGYVCGKTSSYCNPEYCLGPDEDIDAKGEKDGKELDQ